MDSIMSASALRNRAGRNTLWLLVHVCVNVCMCSMYVCTKCMYVTRLMRVTSVVYCCTYVHVYVCMHACMHACMYMQHTRTQHEHWSGRRCYMPRAGPGAPADWRSRHCLNSDTRVRALRKELACSQQYKGIVDVP